MQKSENFRCIKAACGLCCERIADVLAMKDHGDPILDKLIDQFPYKLINGQCPMYKYKRCSVYKDRPLLCNIDKIYDVYPEIAPSRQIWHKWNYDSCRFIINKMEENKIEVFKQALELLGYQVNPQDIAIIYKTADAVRRKGSNISFKMLSQIRSEAISGKPIQDTPVTPEEAFPVDDINTEPGNTAVGMESAQETTTGSVSQPMGEPEEVFPEETHKQKQDGQA